MADSVERIRALRIAAIRGWRVGGGVVLATACERRIATTEARLSIPEVDRGIPLA
jgi:enoyl-CoA hydratase/carnithine racemase